MHNCTEMQCTLAISWYFSMFMQYFINGRFTIASTWPGIFRFSCHISIILYNIFCTRHTFAIFHHFWLECWLFVCDGNGKICNNKKKAKNVRTGEEDIVTLTSLSEDARCKFYHLHSTKCNGRALSVTKIHFVCPKRHKCKRRHVNTYLGLFYPEPLAM